MVIFSVFSISAIRATSPPPVPPPYTILLDGGEMVEGFDGRRAASVRRGDARLAGHRAGIPAEQDPQLLVGRGVRGGRVQGQGLSARLRDVERFVTKIQDADRLVIDPLRAVAVLVQPVVGPPGCEL